MGHIAIIGAGAWGTAQSLVLANKGENVVLWTWQAEHCRAMQSDRENKQFFPGFRLSERVRPTSELDQALSGADIAVMVVPTAAFRETLVELRPHWAHMPLLIASKGVESDTLMLLSEVAEDVLGSDARSRVAVLSGPSFAKEVVLGMPTNVVVASRNFGLSTEVQQRFATERFRIYSSDDPIGVQVGGALKNVIAIAAGACDGLGFGYNTRAALITRGLAEIARVAIAKGGNVLTLAGLAGLGDLVLTCTAEVSRNRTVGFEMGKGKSLKEVLEALGHVAEGVGTAKSAYQLAQQLNVDFPICTEVYRVLYEGKSPVDAVADVLRRPLKKEWG
jgi:glycerol-3-phosphate dehydrogenase (NAD(P)+)